MAVGGKDKTQLPLTPPFKCVGPTSSLLLLETPVMEWVVRCCSLWFRFFIKNLDYYKYLQKLKFWAFVLIKSKELTFQEHWMHFLIWHPSLRQSTLTLRMIFKWYMIRDLINSIHLILFRFSETRLAFADINNKEAQIDDHFKVNVLCKVVKLLKFLCKCWVELPSIRAIMAPVKTLVEAVSLEYYPADVKRLIKELMEVLESLPSEGRPLVREEKKPTAIKMLEPAIEKM